MSKTSALETLETDPPKLAASALDFLLLELVPLTQRITETLAAREQALIDTYHSSKILHDEDGSTSTAQNGSGSASAAKATPTKASKPPPHEHPNTSLPSFDPGPTRDGMGFRLDSIGYRVGQGLVERYATTRPRPLTPLDAIKFLCKDLWPTLYRKPIDNLKTNHRGVFVLTDTRFGPMSHMSVDRRSCNGREADARKEAVARAALFLIFPAGVIRGVLAALGIEAGVVGEVAEIPVATFQIKTRGAKP